MKSLALSLLLAVSLTLAACGSDEASTDATGSESAVDTAADAQMTEPEADAGAAAEMEDAAALFEDRCGRACMADLGSRIGAPLSQTQDGDELVVETPRGGTLRVTGGGDDWFGIVWHYDELDAERQRANQDRLLVEANARTYQRRLEQSAALDGEAPVGEEHPVPPHGDDPAPPEPSQEP